MSQTTTNTLTELAQVYVAPPPGSPAARSMDRLESEHADGKLNERLEGLYQEILRLRHASSL